MRLIQAMVPSGKREAVTQVLKDEEIDFAMFEESSGREYSDVVFFPVEVDEVEEVLDRLRDAGIEERGYLVVSEAEAVISEKLEEKKEEEKKRKEKEEDEQKSPRISRDELVARAQEMSKTNVNYLLFTLVSAVVATAGLLLDSASVVVGSMVIAPLIGPAMASSVGSVVNDDELWKEGVKSQFVGIIVAIASATAFAFLFRFAVAPEVELRLIDQVAERVNPGLLSLVIALGSGIAGSLAITTSISTALVGVMIAVALVPPAATMGLGIAYFDGGLALSSGVLVFVNVLSINLASLITLWTRGYRPVEWFEEKTAKRETLKRVGALVLGVLLLSSFLVATTVNARENMTFEKQAEDAIIGELGSEPAEVNFVYESGLIFREPEGVRLRVASEQSDGLPKELKNAIRERTGESVEVVVVYERTQTTG